MRIALIYTGHIRTWDKCRGNQYLNIITDECDLYWHTYERPPADDTDEYFPIPGEFHQYDGHPYDNNRRPETSVANTLNQWHNNFIGFCMVPKIYDVYVRLRPDITFSDKIDFSQYDCSGNTIYIPHGHNYWDGVNDQVAFGNYEVMKKYYSVYLNHSDIYKHGKIFHTEGYVTENLQRYGVDIVRIPIDNYVIRL